MAGIGICAACQLGDHKNHQEHFTDLSNIAHVAPPARRKLASMLSNNRVCTCVECRNS